MTTDDLTNYEARLFEQLIFRGLPRRGAELITAHVVYGKRPDAFITELLSNNFVVAVRRASDEDRKCLDKYAQALLFDLPIGSWGSPENVIDWQRQGGLQAFAA